MAVCVYDMRGQNNYGLLINGLLLFTLSSFRSLNNLYDLFLKVNTLAHGLIERTSSVLDEITSKNMDKDKESNRYRKKKKYND